MSQPAVAVLIRFTSRLPPEEVERRFRERLVQYRALEGLQQKHYLHDPATGAWAGLYLWRSPDDLAEFQRSELRATIAKAYEVEGEPRVEVYDVVESLRSESAAVGR